MAMPNAGDKELELSSTITQADIDAAVAAFNLHCPPSARGLLEARVEREKEKTSSGV